MTRGLHIALVGLLGLLAAGQVAISLREAVQLPSPPSLFTPAAPVDASPGTSVGEPPPPTVATPLPSPTIATPDPANILRLVARADGLTPARMQAEAGSRLQLMITNARTAACVVEVVGEDERVAVATEPIAPQAEATVSFDLRRGRYRVRLRSTSVEAELTAP